jgi:hypothetical protein
MDTSPHLTLFPLRAPFAPVDFVRLKSSSKIPVSDVLRAKTIATNAYLSLVPVGDARLIEAFEKALAVFSTLLFEPCGVVNPSKDSQNTTKTPPVTFQSSFQGPSKPAHVDQIPVGPTAHLNRGMYMFLYFSDDFMTLWKIWYLWIGAKEQQIIF